jgi:hypothetical protein
VLVPGKKEQVAPYFQAMRSGFSALYPASSFPLSSHDITLALDNERARFQQEYPSVLSFLDKDGLKAELLKKEAGFVKIDLTQTLRALGVSASVFTGVVGADREEHRILMNLVGNDAMPILKSFGPEKLLFEAVVEKDDDNKLFLAVKKTRYLN